MFLNRFNKLLEVSIIIYSKSEKGFRLTKFPANWKRFGRATGPKRNEQMANYADALIAFWDEKSKGTKHMIELAKCRGFKIFLYHITTNEI